MPVYKNSEKYKNNAEYKELREKIRLVEKAGQFNTVHHENMVKYIQAFNEARTPKSKQIITKNEGLNTDGKQKR